MCPLRHCHGIFYCPFPLCALRAALSWCFYCHFPLCALRTALLWCFYCHFPLCALRAALSWCLSSSSMLLYVHRDHKDNSGRGAQDSHLDYDTAPRLWSFTLPNPGNEPLSPGFTTTQHCSCPFCIRRSDTNRRRNCTEHILKGLS